MFQCKDLLSLTSMSKTRIIAGKEGMERGIRWPYKAENLNFEKWVRGQELLIVSSPVTQRKRFDLYSMIKKAIELKMSCALLLIGENYVTEIEDRVINLAEKNNFPLFTMPWNVPLLDFFEELGHVISYIDEKKNIKDSFLAEVIFGNGVDVVSMKQKCVEMGMEESILEQIFVMHLENLKSDQVSTSAQELQDIFQKEAHPALISSYGNRIVGFMKDVTENKELLEKIFTEFSEYLKNEYPNVDYTLNVGAKCEKATELAKNFQDTSKINTLLRKIHKNNQIVFYNQVGYYQMILSYEDQEPMKRFMKEVLGELLKYDEKNHTQLVETLWSYYENDCNMLRTSQQLFSHKNTVKYRLQRVQEITKRDLSNQYQNFELYQALLIYVYLQGVEFGS